MKYPTVTLGGQEFDIYELAAACHIESPPLFNAFKKIIRRGNGAKTERQDLDEAKQSIDRYLRDLPKPDDTGHGTAVVPLVHEQCPWCIPGIDNCHHPQRP